MNRNEALQLKPGDVVRCACYGVDKVVAVVTISTIAFHWGGVQIIATNGDEFECMSSDLELVSLAPPPVSPETDCTYALAKLREKVKDVTGREDILAYAQYPHPGDSHLWVVMAEVQDGYVVWSYNSQQNDLYNGAYCTSAFTPRLQLKAWAYERFIGALKIHTCTLVQLTEEQTRSK